MAGPPCPNCGGAVQVSPESPSALQTFSCPDCGHTCMVLVEYPIPMTEEQRRAAETYVAPEVVAGSPNDVVKLRRLLPELQSSALGSLRAQLVQQGLRWPLRSTTLAEAQIIAAKAATLGLRLEWEVLSRTEPLRKVPLEEILTTLGAQGGAFRRDYCISGRPQEGLVLVRRDGGWSALLIEDEDCAAACRNFLVDQGVHWFAKLPPDVQPATRAEP